MEIWIEDVILDNMIIDSLILMSTNTLAKMNAKKWQIFVSAVFGTAIALLSPILPNLINLLIKPFVAGIMVILAFKTKTIKHFFATYLLFFLITFLYGGASIGICELLGIEYQLSSSFAYKNQIPISVILLVCVFVYFCIKNIIKLVFSRHINDKLFYQIKIINYKKTIEISAFLDTGNLIECDKKPITIINFQTFCKIYPKVKFQDILLKRKIDIKNSRYIEIESLENMKEKIFVFEVDKLTVNGKAIDNALLGLSLKNFSIKTQSDAIISNKILNWENKNET